MECTIDRSESMRNIILFLFLFLTCASLFSQDEPIVLQTTTGKIDGTLRLPIQKERLTLVILHQGSGPTDRNGNQEDYESNSLKYIADVLAAQGIASLRYDIRGIGESKAAMEDVSDMTFDIYVNDLKEWIQLMGKDKRFTKIIVAGHSEGSLIGMIASQNNKKVNAFISIAGAGRPADAIIKDQLSKAPEEIKKSVFEMLDRVKKGDTVENVPPIFYMILNPSVQPYMRSWFKYDPCVEIKKLNQPVLIIQGNKDIQVQEQEAILLSKAYPKAQLKIITNMCHPLKDSETIDKELQKPMYSDPSLPLNKQFVTELLQFISTVK